MDSIPYMLPKCNIYFEPNVSASRFGFAAERSDAANPKSRSTFWLGILS